MHLPVDVRDQRWRRRIATPNCLANDPFDRLHYGITVIGSRLCGGIVDGTEAATAIGRVQRHITTFCGRHAECSPVLSDDSDHG